MTPEEQHEARAEACFNVTRRLAADMRRNPEEVWCRLANLPRIQLIQITSMALALVPAGRIDAWWDRADGLSVEQVHRRRILVGEDAA